MQIGKGTNDFNYYVQNLQRAIEVSSIGAQLTPTAEAPRMRRAMILNPYLSTIADLSICNFRVGTAS